jgi:hypothetical protein
MNNKNSGTGEKNSVFCEKKLGDFVILEENPFKHTLF